MEYAQSQKRKRKEKMKKTDLKKYALLIAKTGLNVQKGQEVWITCGLDQPEFVKMVAEECYKLGASNVRINWTYQPMAKVNVKYRKLKDLGSIPSYKEEELKYQADVVPCRLFLESDDPDGLKGVNIKKMAKARQMQYPTIRKYRNLWENKDQWCIAGVPSVKWAKKLFPELSKKQAVEKLWQSIFQTARITDDPIAEWEKHNADLKKKCAYLNNLGIKQLHYTASNGTDFTVGMIDSGVFCAGADVTLQGITINPNIPSEECFTSPMKGQAEGLVYASKPYCYNGQLIENFWLKFENGKVVDSHAEKNNDLLTQMLNMDEGSRYLGECALVPFDSPINNTGILFYSTLFDENAVCHIALGEGFQDCLRDYEKLTLDEAHAMGINKSMIHEDLMIGTEDLSITALTKDGKTVQIFKDGNWAF